MYLSLIHAGLMLMVGVNLNNGEDWIDSTCVQIPKGMSLCHGIGYTTMRLPNLLGHETMAEVSQQASSWLPLLNVRCHVDSRRFLCSLFSPVCLDRPIFPCRDLCENVKMGCEGRMKMYGFPWPEMFDCKQFPINNDMCIAPQSNADPLSGAENICQTCNQAETYENILDHFCRADFAIRAKFRYVSKRKLKCKKTKVLKTKRISLKLKHPVLLLTENDNCCEYRTKIGKNVYLIMGVFREDKLVPTFIMAWQTKYSKQFKKAVRMFQKLNCSDPKQFSISMISSSDSKESQSANVIQKYIKKNGKSSNRLKGKRSKKQI